MNQVSVGEDHSGKKATGSHYTPTLLANFVAAQIAMAMQSTSPARSVRVLEPAIGEGELLLALAGQLARSGVAIDQMLGFETEEEAIQSAAARLQSSFPAIDLSLCHANFLDFARRFSPYNLLDNKAFEPVDCVIANPPYVRTQALGSATSRSLVAHFGLSGRVDLYHAFMVAIAWVMKPGGVAGIIVSNRFMTTRSGAAVREAILAAFDVLHIWDLGDTKLFHAGVLPSVLILRRKHAGVDRVRSLFSSIYAAKPSGSSDVQSAPGVIEALDLSGYVKVGKRAFRVTHGTLTCDSGQHGIWHMSTQRTSQWLAKVAENTKLTFGDVGKIRVGVKTTADTVYICDNWAEMPVMERPELLRPITTHHVARRYHASDIQKQILYTHEVVDGRRQAVDLSRFPRSAHYLGRHYARLARREYVARAGRNWYELWVPQDPDRWREPKIVFRDISDRPVFWLDFTGSVVNGDCYWITCRRQEDQDLLWLIAAVGNSTFVEQFYDYRFQNRLYAGRRRFITQYVEAFPLPDPASLLAQQIMAAARTVYERNAGQDTLPLQQEIDALVWRAFGFTPVATTSEPNTIR